MEEIVLSWNNFEIDVTNGLHERLRQGDLVDVTLVADGHQIKAHRLVLSICSPYFQKLFTQMPSNQHAFVVLKDVKKGTLKNLINYMYSGEVNMHEDDLSDFISTGQSLKIRGISTVESEIQKQKKMSLLGTKNDSPVEKSIDPLSVDTEMEDYVKEDEEGADDDMQSRCTEFEQTDVVSESFSETIDSEFLQKNKRIKREQRLESPSNIESSSISKSTLENLNHIKWEEPNSTFGKSWMFYKRSHNKVDGRSNRYYAKCDYCSHIFVARSESLLKHMFKTCKKVPYAARREYLSAQTGAKSVNKGALLNEL